MELLNVVTGRAVLTAAFSPTPEDRTPQYLLSARFSVYDDLAERYPIYGGLKAAVCDPQCRVFVIRPSGRELIAQAGRVFAERFSRSAADGKT